MAHGRPYYHAYPADYFTATQGWDLDMKGPYRLLIDLLNERDRPFPDDPRFVAGVLGCSVQRWKKIREFLIFEGKLMLTEDGQHLTNPRFEREHMSRADIRAAAQLNGHLGGLERARRAGQTDMEFEPPRTRTRAPTEEHKKSKKVGKKIENNSKKHPSDSQLPTEEPPENSELSQGPPCIPCARDSSETIVQKDSTLPISVTDSREGRLANADLFKLFEACCDAAGFNPIQPAAIDRAMAQVEKWLDLGIDFDLVVIPSIRAVVLASDDPTRALSRFQARVLHEHARAKAAEKKAAPYRPPEIPHLSPDGEDPAFLPLRTELLEECGDRPYCSAFNHVRFEDAGQCQGDKRPLRIIGPDHLVENLRHGRWKPILLATARKYDFTEIW